MANIMVEYTERKEFNLLHGWRVDLYGDINNLIVVKSVFCTDKPSEYRLAEMMAEYHCKGCTLCEAWELGAPVPDDLPFY